jgi:hypothetical protein
MLMILLNDFINHEYGNSSAQCHLIDFISYLITVYDNKYMGKKEK